jgi:uncharacterized membrane protein YqhA
MNNVQKATQNFIAQIANKDYAQAKTALQNVVAEKIKNKVRTYINQEK